MDVAYVDGSEVLQCIEHLLKGDMVLPPDRPQCMARESCLPCPWQPVAKE